MEVSKQASKQEEDSNIDAEGNNSNALFWILGGMMVLGVVLYYKNDIKDKNLS